MMFKEIKDDILKDLKKKELEERLCGDNLVAKIKYSDDKWDYIAGENLILKEERIKDKEKLIIKEKTKLRIIIILESPHIEEYTEEEPYPALGESGEALNEYLLKILNNNLKNDLNTEKEYDIILMNAINYQASLGLDTQMFRDRVWLNMWIKYNKRKDFIKRLEDYQPDIIMNFCTRGSHTLDLIYTNEVSVCMKNIRDSYINELNIDGIEIDKSGNVKKGEELLASSIKNYKSNKRDRYEYTLQCFVGNAINSAKLKNVNFVICQGMHPSSWRRMLARLKEEEFLEKFIKV